MHAGLFVAVHWDNVRLHSPEWKSAILLIKTHQARSLLKAQVPTPDKGAEAILGTRQDIFPENPSRPEAKCL